MPSKSSLPKNSSFPSKIFGRCFISSDYRLVGYRISPSTNLFLKIWCRQVSTRVGICALKYCLWGSCIAQPPLIISSVGVAQYIHRNFLRKVQGDPKALMPYAEIRHDRSLSLSNPRRRVYFHNLDLLHNVIPDLVGILEGEVSDHMASLITCYNQVGIPLNNKKSVKQKTFAEIQGAEIDGSLGVSRPKGEKMGKYASAAVSLLRKKKCSRKEIQVVCGGLVYFSMFRRPLMSYLNYVWRII